jgi:uncharacterized membrane protein YfcA
MIAALGWSVLPVEIQDDVFRFIALGSVSAMLVSLAKGGFGGSLGLLSVPIMIYACRDNTQLAIGITLPLLIACDYVALVSWWRRWNLRPVLLLLPGAVLGMVLGAATLWAMRRVGGGGASKAGVSSVRANALLMLGIGLIAVAFVVLQGVRALRAKPVAFRPGFWGGTATGAVAGYTSTLAHAGGPVVTMYMLPQQMPKGTFVATTVLYYWIGNQLKLPFYFTLRLIDTNTLGGSLVLLPAVVGGTLLGIFLHYRVKQRQFTGIIYALLALAGADLIRKAVEKLFW